MAQAQDEVVVSDIEVIIAVDARQLKGRVGCITPGCAVAYVKPADLEKWRAERPTNYGTEPL